MRIIEYLTVKGVSRTQRVVQRTLKHVEMATIQWLLLCTITVITVVTVVLHYDEACIILQCFCHLTRRTALLTLTKSLGYKFGPQLPVRTTRSALNSNF